jgi:Na+/H+ antiporter NhaD/arsenite permease-like protein
MSYSNCLAITHVPPVGWIGPFAALLLVIAVFPLISKTAHWWERNRNKLLVALLLAAGTLVHYQARGYGTILHDPALVKALQALRLEVREEQSHAIAAPGWATSAGALGNALFEYVPFIVLLFALYCISGGILVRGDIPAHPLTNTFILALGGVLANLIGTTGASMLLIRPLLQTNSERKHIAHTVIFFIFIVSNVGGCLLPIGDPPLFLGYLRGVPFFWTLQLWKEWAFVIGLLLFVYFVWDSRAYRREAAPDVARDERTIQSVRMLGNVNFVWLALVVAVVAMLAPGVAFPGTRWVPPPFTREAILLALVGLSFLTTPSGLRHANRFNFHAIGEVACLFIGIFITMQVPLEILAAKGGELGLTQPWHFFWATGALSGFLDNAPTYAVFFQTANALTHQAGPGVLQLLDGNFIRQDLLVAISLGAVFMGAGTYIGNGPNFMVKSIAEQHGVRMPSFFGYLLYAAAVLIPIYVAVSLVFL